VSFDYAKSAATALSLLTKFGVTVTVKRRTAGVYNPATGEAMASGVAEQAKGALLPYAPYIINNSNGSIRQEDARLLLSPNGLGAAPEPQDQVAIGNATFTIVNVQKLAPAGTVVLYDAQVRR
jgi:hypothetical protein